MVRNRYDPVEYRQNYFTHFSERINADTFTGKVKLAPGLSGRDDKLPTDIAGITYMFRPKKNGLETSCAGREIKPHITHWKGWTGIYLEYSM